MFKREKKLERKIAKERIEILFRLIEEVKKENYDLARRYVELARKIAMKYRIKLPKEFKLKFCKKCLYPYKEGRFRVRIAKSRVIITCLNCGYVRRIPIRPIRQKISKENKKEKT